MTAKEFIEEYIDYLDKDMKMFIKLATFIGMQDREEFLEIIRILDSVGIDTKDVRIALIEEGIKNLIDDYKITFRNNISFETFDAYVTGNLKFPLGLTEDDVEKCVHRVYDQAIAKYKV